MKNKNLFLIIILSFVFYSCEKDEIGYELAESIIQGFFNIMLTGEPIVGATVYLHDGVEGSTLIKSVVTDENGEFKFNLPANSGYTNDLYLQFSSDLLSDYKETSNINGVTEIGIFRKGLPLDVGQNYSFEIELTPKK